MYVECDMNILRCQLAMAVRAVMDIVPGRRFNVLIDQSLNGPY